MDFFALVLHKDMQTFNQENFSYILKNKLETPLHCVKSEIRSFFWF